MLVLHAHWISPRRADEIGGVLFWAEDSTSHQPTLQHGRLPQKPRPKSHPFQATVDTMKSLLMNSGASRDSVILNLPATRTGPFPSPVLAHNWTLDRDSKPFIAPWIITGIRLSPRDALPLLLDLPIMASKSRIIVLGEDASYWRIAATIVLEAMAAQKLMPTMIPAKNGFRARWMPVLDSPRDAQRLGFMERNMPTVCRSEVWADKLQQKPPTPKAVLTSFLNGLCDSLARQWGRDEIHRFSSIENQIAYRWLAALLREDSTIKGAAAQINSLNSSYLAWSRNLHLSGDSIFRIAFRLEPPGTAPALNGSGKENGTEQPWKIHYLLQAKDDPTLFISADEIWKSASGMINKLGRRFDRPQERLLAGLGFAARLFSPISASLKGKNPTHLNLDTRQAYTFLREVAPVLEEAGFGFIAPPWWNKPGARLGMRLRLQPTRPIKKDALQQGRLSFDKLIHYQWELSIGGTSLTEEEFRALAALKTPLVQIRDQWVQLDPEQVQAAINFWERQKLEGKISLLEALQMGMNATELSSEIPVEEVVTEDWFNEWMNRLSQPANLSELPQPDGIKGELRPYQRFGFSWLSFFRQWQLGACLADDMGLGKTIQTLALLVKEKEIQGSFATPVLLICPTSVVINWEREVRRFAPGLRTLLHQGPNRPRGEEFTRALQEVDLVLTSYTLVRQDAEMMQAVKWHAVILDEAQNIKNPAARQTQVIRQLPAGFRVALTGTPVENRLMELWSIMNFLNPGYLGTRETFRTKYALPIERYNNVDAAQQLRRMVNPFILRRLKTDPTVIQDLPEKVETKLYCNLTEEQATLYEAVVQDSMKRVEESDGINRRGNVLSMLLKLKQVCNHPAQFMHAANAQESLANDLINRSGKLERLVEILEEIIAEGDRVLIFTQFVEMGEILEATLPQAIGSPVLFMHGGTPAKTRDNMVQRFQEEPNGPQVFILSLKAGGTGLNLTRASHVVHFDRWWNPAVENQATDRAFRIGQKQNVQVHKFITAGTLEEMIDDIIESKKELVQSILGSGENWLTELNTADLRNLVQLRRE
jgi:SNF2 family DNA or RNA helicase